MVCPQTWLCINVKYLYTLNICVNIDEYAVGILRGFEYQQKLVCPLHQCLSVKRDSLLSLEV